MTDDIQGSRATIAAFLRWLIHHDDGVVLALDPTQHLREVVSDAEIAALILRHERAQEDAAIAADERQAETMPPTT